MVENRHRERRPLGQCVRREVTFERSLELTSDCARLEVVVTGGTQRSFNVS
jgi:hypothetical protein